MLSDLTPAQITLLGVTISLEIYNSFSNNEANAINNLLAGISSNLSVLLAQEALIKEKKGDNGEDDDVQPLSSFGDKNLYNEL